MALPDERRCTAKSKQRHARCLLARVPGRTVCRFHGGRAGRPPKHGFAAKLTGDEEVRYDELVATLDCTKAFAYVQAKLESGTISKADLSDPETLQTITEVLRRQIHSAKMLKETLEGATFNVRISDGSVMEALLDVFRKYVPRKQWADAIAEIRAAART